MTLNEVAEHAGVSRATASLVIRGTGRVSEATRNRVQQSMHTLGYVYNRGAASLRSRHGDTIGVVVTNLANPFFGELLKGLEHELNQAGYTCLLVDTNNDVDAQYRAVTELRERQVASLAIVPASGTTGDFVDMLNAWGMEHIFMTRYLRDVETHYVGADDVLGGRLAAEHLLEHGRTTFAYAGGPESVLSRWDRITGATQALQDHGLTASALADYPGETSGRGGLAIAKQLLAQDRLPEAILCHSDHVAFGIYRALRQHGRSGETRVIGYDDIATAALWEPPLTSVSTRSTELGQRAAQTLLTHISTPADHPVVTTTQPTLVVRESCGCPA
ncbi:LacI family DNA-binding transcriptional regulator [Parasphingorhabdus pacifica]